VTSPSSSPYPIPVPADPNDIVVSLVFLLVLFAVVSLLWWQIRRTRRGALDLEDGRWASDDPPDAR
jgi:hypothetical protein